MIQTLHISNYALIDSIDIDFDSGLNIITGETGAGKSIILGALNLILGDRADMQSVSDHTRKSIIEARFTRCDSSKFNQWFNANDFDWLDDGTITLRREIYNGRSRAFINDTPATLERLQWVASRLVDIHSQHQNSLLGDPEFQLDVIDSLTETNLLKHEYTQAYREYRRALKEYSITLQRIQRNRTDKDFIKFQLDQFDNLDLQPGEKEDLEQQRQSIADIAETKVEVTSALDILCNDEQNVIDIIANLSDHISAIGSSLDNSEDIMSRIDSINIELTDISNHLQRLNAKLKCDNNDLEVIDNRLRRIEELEQRHNVETADCLIDIKNQLQKQLDELEGADIILKELKRSAAKAKAVARDTATLLSQKRKAAAQRLSTELYQTASPLGMPNLTVDIDITESELSPTGADTIDFKFAFNKNQTPIGVKGAASGGEISRLMLSLKTIIAQTMALPTIIFDEVDTGVSGDVANRMGEMMSAIAQSRQVIVITHLPQVAAKGQRHFKVYKHDDETATHTYIRLLTRDERISELATMLSGAPNNEAARQTALHLLNLT